MSANSWALDVPSASGLKDKALSKGTEVFQACKEEQVKYCKSYTQLDPLKKCLEENKSHLSAKCKAATGL
jgi:hypothetical protein